MPFLCQQVLETRRICGPAQSRLFNLTSDVRKLSLRKFVRLIPARSKVALYGDAAELLDNQRSFDRPACLFQMGQPDIRPALVPYARTALLRRRPAVAKLAFAIAEQYQPRTPPLHAWRPLWPVCRTLDTDQNPPATDCKNRL